MGAICRVNDFPEQAVGRSSRLWDLIYFPGDQSHTEREPGGQAGGWGLRTDAPWSGARASAGIGGPAWALGAAWVAPPGRPGSQAGRARRGVQVLRPALAFPPFAVLLVGRVTRQHQLRHVRGRAGARRPVTGWGLGSSRGWEVSASCGVWGCGTDAVVVAGMSMSASPCIACFSRPGQPAGTRAAPSPEPPQAFPFLPPGTVSPLLPARLAPFDNAGFILDAPLVRSSPLSSLKGCRTRFSSTTASWFM